MNIRLCYYCGQQKDKSEMRHNHISLCNSCYQLRNYAGIEHGKIKRIYETYELTYRQYAEMLNDQQGVCAVCGGSPDEGKRLFIDHDHKTGKVRGLLCNKCNTALGFANDDTSLLKKLIKYLVRNKSV